MNSSKSLRRIGKQKLLYVFFKLIKLKSHSDEKHNKPFDLGFFRNFIKIFNKLVFLFQPIRKDVRISEEILDNNQCFYLQASQNAKRNILYLHGGGYVLGLKNETEQLYKAFCAELAVTCSVNIWLIDYGTIPETTICQIIDNVYGAYLELLKKCDPSTDIVIMGDSAGGGLALLLLMKLRDNNMRLPKAAILISPWTDLAVVNPSIKNHVDKDPLLTPFKVLQVADIVRGNYLATDPRISSLYGDFTGLPSMMFVVGKHEILYDDAFLAAQKAHDAGVEVNFDVNDTMFHVYPIFSGFLEEAQFAIVRMATYMNSKVCGD